MDPTRQRRYDGDEIQQQEYYYPTPDYPIERLPYAGSVAGHLRDHSMQSAGRQINKTGRAPQINADMDIEFYGELEF